MAYKKKIYLVRHAQTEFNHQQILQGSRVDLSLNETGKRQANLFYNKYKSLPFKKIYTSPLKRSIESVALFIEEGIPVETISDLQEMDYGLADGKISAESSLYKNLNREWEHGNLSLKVQGGESPLQVQSRISHFIDYILDRPREDLILVCLHGRALRILLATLLGYELSYMHLFKHANMGLYILEFSEEIFYMEKYNDVSHLYEPSVLGDVFKCF